MIVKVGDKVYNKDEQSVVVQLSDSDIEAIIKYKDNPKWQKKLALVPAGWNEDMIKKYIDDMPEDLRKYNKPYKSMLS